MDFVFDSDLGYISDFGKVSRRKGMQRNQTQPALWRKKDSFGGGVGWGGGCRCRLGPLAGLMGIAVCGAAAHRLAVGLAVIHKAALSFPVLACGWPGSRQGCSGCPNRPSSMPSASETDLRLSSAAASGVRIQT